MPRHTMPYAGQHSYDGVDPHKKRKTNQHAADGSWWPGAHTSAPKALSTYAAESRSKETRVGGKNKQVIAAQAWYCDTEIGTFKIIGSLFVLQTDEAQDFKIVTKVVKNVRPGSYYMSN